MSTLEDELRAALSAQADALRVPDRPVLDRDASELDHRPRRLWPIAAACMALIVMGAVLLAERDGSDPQTVAAGGPDVTVPGPAVNGWVAFETEYGFEGADEGGIDLVRPGEEARPLEIDGSDRIAGVCPAWSPDGTRLLLARTPGPPDARPHDAELVVVPVSRDGEAGDPTVIPLEGFSVLGGFSPQPCGTWAPDGRWVALRANFEVWLVDTQTGDVRRLAGLRPVDLAWRPGTDELAIAGDVGVSRGANRRSTPVTIYSVSTGELRELAVEASEVTWSPDGSTLAYTGTRSEDGQSGLWLVDADGGNQRLLVADMGRAMHGLGPQWSPAGDRIVYQRSCCTGEHHAVVVVDVADGTETVVESLLADMSGEQVRVFPFTVSWSPDGATLLYMAWTALDAPRELAGEYVLTAPADDPGQLTVLSRGGIGSYKDHKWIRTWGRLPD